MKSNRILPLLAASAALALPAAGNVVISQFYEGSSFNKYIELQNTGAGPVTLTDYTLTLWSNANTEGWKMDGATPTAVLDLSSVTLLPGEYFLLANPSADSPGYAASSANIDDGVINFNGDDSVVLYSTPTFDTANILDAVSFTDAGSEGSNTSFYRIANDVGDGSSYNLTAGSTVLDFPAVWAEESNGNVDAAADTDAFYLQAQVPTESLTIDSIVPPSFSEDAGPGAAVVTVSRSGSTVGELEVTVTISDPSEAAAPTTFLIADTEATGTFELEAIDDSSPDGDVEVTVTVEAFGYAAGEETFTVEDDGNDVFMPSAALISQYYEGASSDKYVEIQNVSGSEVTLDGYTLALYTNSSSEDWKTGTGSPTNTYSLDGITLPAGGFYLVKNSNAANPPYAATGADDTSTVTFFNGNDSVVLFYNGSGGLLGDVADALSFPGDQSVGGETSFYRLTNDPGFDTTAGTTPLDYPAVWAEATLEAVDGASDTDPFYLANGSPNGPLTVNLAASSVSEGAGAMATTATISREGTEGVLEVTLTSSNLNAATVPASVTIADGETTSPAFDIAAVDNAEINADQVATITASAALYNDGSADLAVLDDEATPLIVNEILADPPFDGGDPTVGDANGDGVRDGIDDEFLELVNATGSPLDISGWAIVEETTVLHIFPASTELAVDQAIVIFGGGTPTGDFGGAIVQTASEDVEGFGLSLSNAGDELFVADALQQVVAFISYGAAGGNDESLSRDPDLTGAFTGHTGIADAGGAAYSPGTRTGGSAFTVVPGGDIAITGVSRSGSLLTIEFTGPAGAAGSFSVTGSPDLQTAFSAAPVTVDTAPAEGAAGEYSVVVDTSANGSTFFYRVEN